MSRSNDSLLVIFGAEDDAAPTAGHAEARPAPRERGGEREGVVVELFAPQDFVPRALEPAGGLIQEVLFDDAGWSPDAAALAPTPRAAPRSVNDDNVAPQMDPDVAFAVLIPVYQHSVLLIEAVESALAQSVEGKLAVVIVNDGCPHLETHLLCQSLARVYDNIVYLQKANGGPSSARNCGIEHIVGAFPNLKAAFFLDADNRLSSDAIAHGWSLLERDPGLGWIYPSYNAFEVEWSGDYSVPYSRLLHYVHANLCDTGSLVRAEMLRQLRFNTDDASGFEDWDFWLDAVAHGYRGQCSPALGLEYRMRAESRCRDAIRDEGSIARYLRERHKASFTPRRLLGFEHEESPRFCWFDTTSMTARLFTDPTLPAKTVPTKEFCRTYWAAEREPEHFLVPKLMFWGSVEVLASLAEAGLAHTVLWLVERQLKEHQFVAVSLTQDKREISVSVRKPGAGQGLPEGLAFIAGQVDAVRSGIDAPNPGWLESLGSKAPKPSVVEIAVAAPLDASRHMQPLSALVRAVGLSVANLRNSSYRQEPDVRWSWRMRMFPPIGDYPGLLEKHLGVATLLPLASEPARADVAFVVPFGLFGGSEKVSYAGAREMRKAGFRTHLFVVGGGGYKVIPEFADAFDTINLIGNEAPSLWGGARQARGTEFGVAVEPAMRTPVLLGLLAGMDVVVNCHTAPLNAAIANLRALGIVTVSYLHLFDRTANGREAGHPFLGLLYEYAYDLVLLCSHNLRRRLHALGMPSEKLLTIENAPGFSIPPQKLASIRRKRSEGSERLRVIYVGRMDTQKGLERIAGIVERCAAVGLDIDFRFIGASLVDRGRDAVLRERLQRANVRFEPPVYSAEKLTAALAKADVMILPSRWEGAPLAILEAQQAGCIPIATDVGAVSELIEHGADGLLVPDGEDQAVVTGFVGALVALHRDGKARRRIALEALDRLCTASWERSFAPFVARMVERFPARDR